MAIQQVCHWPFRFHLTRVGFWARNFTPTSLRHW